MKISTFKFSNREVKELRWQSDNLKSIQWAERQKARLENLGFSLKASSSGFCSDYLAYVKYDNQALNATQR